MHSYDKLVVKPDRRFTDANVWQKFCIYDVEVGELHIIYMSSMCMHMYVGVHA